MDSNYFEEDLLQVRQILEVAAVKMAAERRTQEDLKAIKAAQQVFADQTLNFESGIEENILFHLKVVSASNNEVIKSLFLKIIPDLLNMFNKRKQQDNIKYLKGIKEHDLIIDNLVKQDVQEAERVMELHLENESS